MVFFFKQKTAYEMRISDWSSDVCSSDLLADFQRGRNRAVLARGDAALDLLADDVVAHLDAFVADEHGRARTQLANLVLRLAAEGAAESAIAVGAAQFCHHNSSGGHGQARRPPYSNPRLGETLLGNSVCLSCIIRWFP